ncbi:hypothetical protein F906_00277 [Acinetobacter pseudolwoffii]|uniref:Sulfatase N-terminal domain-containing protein n=1 Tax=Acinetobacter pseudolwoffii TaxID=2053287 RepID=N9KWG6_9GAMM|nr:sulfatase-like hydrolase/transferase [Acinetobacter pseudolwoffii]ENW88368.1 hypothetical protein F906_00277 [Acinetobacter pseudolwoffii]
MAFYIFFVLVNIVLYFSSLYLGLDRVPINIDYLICLMIAIKYRKIACFLFFLVVLADVLLLLRQVFPFFRIEDIVFILRFVFLASFYYQLFIFIFIIFLLISVMFFYKSKIIAKKNIYFFLMVVLIFLLESIYGALQLNQTKKITESYFVNFVTLQFYGFSQSLRMEGQDFTHFPYTVSTQALFEQKPKGHVLFILNESFGMPQDHRIVDELLQPLYMQQDKVSNLEVAQSSYVMPTLYAELRELCHMQPNNFNMKNIDSGFEHCLPHIYKKNGYQTFALHGALGVMYDRKYWYPKVGFDKTIFYEDKSWNKRCYSFPGACDIEMVEEVVNIFKSEGSKKFVYWLTLNSHAVYDSRDIFIDRFSCEKFNIEKSTESCRNLKLQAQFFSILAQMIDAPFMKNITVVVVGDHSPAIFNINEKMKNFEGDNVLMLKFDINNEK